MPKPFIQGIGLAAIIIILDQASKWWVVEHLMNPPHPIEITSFFNLVLTHNRGVSFGMFAAGSEKEKWVLIGVALTISLFLLRWLWQTRTTLGVIALGLIIGGALGNVIDRATLGAVVDFLDFHAFGQHWPAFNVADSAIFVGAAALMYESFFHNDRSA